MKDDDKSLPSSRRWAEFRFSVIGGLLSSPPKKKELREKLMELSERKWKHPLSGEPTKFGLSTIEGWYYRARRERGSPVDGLRTKIRSDSGRFKSIGNIVKETIKKQYLEHQSWSYKLHADNIRAVFGRVAPSYGTIRRYMKRIGLAKKKRLKKKFLKNKNNPSEVFESRETRGFENEYSNGLWHADFHHSSLQVITQKGKWETPIILAILDDHSRLICHAQWYLAENTKNLVHAFSQAVLKRGLPRSFLTDNGSSFTSQEVTQGLTWLGIAIDNTLPYHPWQNGKQERFFGTLETRLMDMLENKRDLTLKELNDYTVAWIEMEYHRSVHDEIKCSPLERFVKGTNVGRPSPSLKELQVYFCREEGRKQRFTDGTISLNGQRYEIPSRYRALATIWVRYADWDMSVVHMADRTTGKILERIYPIDKTRNANQGRKMVEDIDSVKDATSSPSDEVAPLLKKYLEEHNAKRMPSSYLIQDEHL